MHVPTSLREGTISQLPVHRDKYDFSFIHPSNFNNEMKIIPQAKSLKI